MPGKYYFIDCLSECLSNKVLITEYNRLMGATISTPAVRAPIDIIIDDVTGYSKALKEQQEKELMSFIDFVFKNIWLPVCSHEQNKDTPNKE